VWKVGLKVPTQPEIRFGPKCKSPYGMSEEIQKEREEVTTKGAAMAGGRLSKLQGGSPWGDWLCLTISSGIIRLAAR